MSDSLSLRSFRSLRAVFAALSFASLLGACAADSGASIAEITADQSEFVVNNNAADPGTGRNCVQWCQETCAASNATVAACRVNNTGGCTVACRRERAHDVVGAAVSPESNTASRAASNEVVTASEAPAAPTSEQQAGLPATPRCQAWCATACPPGSTLYSCSSNASGGCTAVCTPIRSRD